MRPNPTRRLDVLADGTVKQRSAVTGTEVWTVPGRANRPLPGAAADPAPLPPTIPTDVCAFCPARYLETPPERARLVMTPGADPSTRWRLQRDPSVAEVTAEVADFRRIPNLFPILPLTFWQADHGYVVPAEVRARIAAYLADPTGRAHVLAVERTRRLAGGAAAPVELEARTDAELVESVAGLFTGGHDVIVARRHYVDGAVRDDQLCSSGDLTPDEHEAFLALTVDALHELAVAGGPVRYVSVFQNWLRPAGASFDHLHKQLVAVDEVGPLMQRIEQLLDADPGLFAHQLADPAARDRLVIAENAHGVALAGVGHRYPTIEVVSTSSANRPWEHDPAAVRGMSDLLHACHAATGRRVPSNEEWHYRPLGSEHPMPWRILLKWRVSTLAGFEGGTKINVNTISPFVLRDRAVAAMADLRTGGRIATVAIGDECSHRLGALAYAQ